MKRIPLHARSLALAQHILGTACAQLELAPPKVIPNDDDRELFVAAWCLDPIFIPDEKIIFISEPNARVPGNALYLDVGEAVLNKLPGLRYLVRIRIIEIQDWSTPLPPLMTRGMHLTMKTGTPMTGTSIVATPVWMAGGCHSNGLATAHTDWPAIETPPLGWEDAANLLSSRAVR
jgi:hypothetical protein